MGPGASALNGAARATWGPRGPRGLTLPCEGGLVSGCQGNPRERGHESLSHLFSKTPVHSALFHPGPCGWVSAPWQEHGCRCVWGTRAAGQACVPGQRALLPEGCGQGLVPVPPTSRPRPASVCPGCPSGRDQTRGGIGAQSREGVWRSEPCSPWRHKRRLLTAHALHSQIAHTPGLSDTGGLSSFLDPLPGVLAPCCHPGL